MHLDLTRRLIRPAFLLSALALGAAPAIAGDPYATKSARAEPLTAAREAELVAAFDALLAAQSALPYGVVAEVACSGADGKCAGKECECHGATALGALLPAKKLAHALAEQPEGWKVIEPRALAALNAKGATCDVRDRIVGVLAVKPTVEAQAVAERLAQAAPASFTPERVLVLAESGSKTFAQRLENACAKKEAGTCATSVASAAMLAFQGNGAGKPALVRATSAVGCESGGTATALLASAALAKLGDEAAWKKALDGAHGQVLAALDAGDLARARKLALQVDFARSTLAEPWGPHLAWFERRLGHYCEARADKLASADQVFALIEKLAAS